MDGAAVQLFQYGLAGVVILGQFYVIGKLWTKIQSLYDIIQTSQEARRVDALQTAEKTTELANNVTQAVTLIGGKIESTGRRAK